MTELKFFTPDEPRPQGSKRYIGNGRFIEQSKYLPAWREAIKDRAEKARDHRNATIIPKSTPVAATYEFLMPRPKRLKNNTEPHTKAPDIDKLQRAVNDAITGVLIKDDSQITTVKATKRYANPNEQPGLHLTIKENQ